MRKQRPTQGRGRRTALKHRKLSSFETLETRLALDASVVFNEIMYHPDAASGLEGDYEWVELYNQMAINMDISGWSLEGAVDFTFPQGTIIPGKSYLVVSANPTALAAETGFAGSLGPFIDRLGNEGETLRLIDRNGRELSIVEYGDNGAWPVGPDGSGFSLAKIDAMGASADPVNWTTSRQINGTPGALNFIPPGQSVQQTLIAPGATASYLVPSSGGLGSSWTQAGFNDASWATGPTGIGFDTTSGGAAGASEDGAGAGGSLIDVPPADNGPEPLDEPGDGGGGAAIDTTWTGGAGSNLWSAAGNWTGGVPTSGDRAFINGATTLVVVDAGNALAGRVLIGDTAASNSRLRVTGGNLNVSGDVQRIDVGTAGKGTLEILGGTTTVAGNLYAGVNSSSTTAQGTITINAGTLNVGGRILLGVGSNVTQTQILNMAGGTLTASALFVADGAYATAIVNMTGGSMNLGTLAIPTNYGEPGLDGHFQLDGGIVTVTNTSTGGTQNLPSGFRLANGPPNPPNNPADVEEGTMDITGGTLKLAGDVTSLVSSYIAAGVLTGYGNPDYIVYDYNVTNPGYTTVRAQIPSVDALIETDIQAQMHGVNATVYTRNEFQIGAASAVDTLSLHVKYNDGFIAYLNGMEVARRNAPISATWNSAATAPVSLYIEESIDISAFAGALVAGGENVLAIQGLNASAADSNFVVLPELTATLVADTAPDIAFNEIPAASGSGFWVEIVNRGSTSVGLNGFRIETSAGTGSAFVFGSENLAPGARRVVTQAELGYGAISGDKLFLLTANRDRLLDARVVTTQLRGLAPGYGDRWLFPSAATPGAANAFTLQNDVVINEIMYHAAPQSPESGTQVTTQLVAIDSITMWRYNQKGVDLGTSWYLSSHAVDNVNWLSGPALLAFEPDPLPEPIRTTLDNPQITGPGDPFVVTTYFETDFTFSGSLNDVSYLELRHVVDDGAVFYLNGQEIARFNIAGNPGDPVAASVLASNVGNAVYQGPVTVPKERLLPGVNRLSVEVHQVNSSSADITFGADLRAISVSPSIPFVESDEEWIELYNRGGSTVNLSGWQLQDGIEFTFPLGTTIAPGAYLVVSNNAAELAARYPGVAIIGNFAKSLSNSSDRILLVAADGNPADEVRYYDEGKWAEYADGGGSSLELRNPFADNSKAEAWAASDERDGGVWQTFTILQTASADTGPGIWNEFLFGMLDEGEVLIDDVSVIANPSGAATQLIQNGTFQADTLGSAPQKWRIIGNHHGTVVADPSNASNKVLQLRATGTTAHESNNAGTTFVGNTPVVNGQQYLISFKARWLAGSSQLNARSYLSRLAATVVLDVPQNTGTPGAQNSTYVANSGPTYSDFKHGPVVPEAGQAVTVSVRAADSNGISSVALFWSVDGGSWNNAAMSLGADGLYTGTIPGQSAGTVVQFYVRGQDSLGVTSTYPGGGANSRALYEVNDGAGTSAPIDTVRIIMLTADANQMLDTTKAMSNELIGATVVYNNQEVFYDVGARPKGSSRSRLDSRYWGSYNIHFQPDQLFRGVYDQISLDSSGSSSLVSFGQDEILVKQVINAAGGIPTAYDDLAYGISPISAQNGPVIIQLARYEDVFLDESYANGSDGELFEYELVYYAQQTIDGNVESLKKTEPNGVIGASFANLGNSNEDYRWNFLLKNNRDEDDYSRLIAAAQVFSLTGSAFLNAVDDVIDVDQWLRVFAAANLNGIGDSYVTGGNKHNTQFYVRPDDGRVLIFPWDWDVAYVQSTGAGLVLNSDLSKLLASPAYQHAYYGHLQDIIATSFNAAYITPWTLHFGSLVGQNYAPHITYIQNRATSVTNQLNTAVPQVPFAITTNGGNGFTVDALQTSLAGSGWINVREIRLAGNSQPLPINWTTVDDWQVNVPLSSGVNNLTIEAYDFQGNLVGSDTIAITSTHEDTLQRDSLRITELMYHPSNPPPGDLVDSEEFEYVEIKNISSEPVNLQGVQFVTGITFTFPSMMLAPGQHVLIVENADAFASRYPGSTALIAGQYSGKLDNAGEALEYRDSQGQTIQNFTYLDDDWYPETDGNGYSLVIVDPLGPLSAWSQKAGWRPSANIQGSPGVNDVTYLDADVNFDGVVDIFDVNVVSDNWGTAGPTGDANHDGVVDIFDVNVISDSWGQTSGGGAVAFGAPEQAVQLAEEGDSLAPGAAAVNIEPSVAVEPTRGTSAPIGRIVDMLMSTPAPRDVALDDIVASIARRMPQSQRSSTGPIVRQTTHKSSPNGDVDALSETDSALDDAYRGRGGNLRNHLAARQRTPWRQFVGRFTNRQSGSREQRNSE